MIAERRGRGDPQHRRRRLAGLGRPTPPARGARSRRCRAAASCSIPARTCSTPWRDLAGEDVTEVAAWLEDDGSPGRHARRGHGPAGVRRARDDERAAAGRSRRSDRTSACSASGRRCGPGSGASTWRSSAPARTRSRPSRPSRSRTVWEQFLAVRAGLEPNPSPPEVGPAHGPAVGRDPRVVRARRRGRSGPSDGTSVRGMTVRVTVWNEFRQEHTDAAGRGDLPGRDPRRHRGRPARGGRLRGPDGDARRAGARPDRRRPRRDGRADLVGPRRPRRGLATRSSIGSTRASSTGWGWSSSTPATSPGSSSG